MKFNKLFVILVVFSLTFVTFTQKGDEKAKETTKKTEEKKTETAQNTNDIKDDAVIKIPEDDDSDLFTPEDGKDGKPNQDFQEQQDRMRQQEEQRQSLTACIISTKHKMYADQSEMNKVLELYQKDQKKQSQVYRKAFGELIELCSSTITPQQSQQIIVELNEQRFNVADHLSIFMKFSYKKFEDTTIETRLTKNQQALLQYTEEFEKAMKDRQEQEEEQEEQTNRVKPEDYEPKIAGFSIKDSSKGLQIAYLGGIFAIFAVVIFFAAKKLLKEEEPKFKKKKSKEDRKKSN